MSAEATDVIVKLPGPVARRGITEPQWRTLANNLYPGAASDSVLMVWDYCIARQLDPLKKPCHIVPMRVKDAKSGDYIWRDVVMPGIYEYRTTANRTGLYLGHSKPVYGPIVEFCGASAPEFCELIVYKWNPQANMRAEFPVEIRFSEVCTTKKDKQTGKDVANDRWSRAPQQMLTKCAEAAALREAFPEELGGTHTVEEMDGKVIEGESVEKKGADPRGDLSGVDSDIVNKWYGDIVDILNQDKDEYAIADMCREAALELNQFQEVYISVVDKLAKEKVITKSNWRRMLDTYRPEDRQERAHA